MIGTADRMYCGYVLRYVAHHGAWAMVAHEGCRPFVLPLAEWLALPRAPMPDTSATGNAA